MPAPDPVRPRRAQAGARPGPAVPGVAVTRPLILGVAITRIPADGWRIANIGGIGTQMGMQAPQMGYGGPSYAVALSLWILYRR